MGGPEVLLVVARDRPEVYSALSREFADAREQVAVVYDRRFGERRRRVEGFSPDRRQTDRRRHDVETDLRSLGRAIIRRGE